MRDFIKRKYPEASSSVTFNINEDIEKLIYFYIEKGEYKNKSEFCRVALYETLNKNYSKRKINSLVRDSLWLEGNVKVCFSIKYNIRNKFKVILCENFIFAKELTRLAVYLLLSKHDKEDGKLTELSKKLN